MDYELDKINKYIFTSYRLGFRNWKDSDLEELAKINLDKEVMEFFPSRLTKEGSSQFIFGQQMNYNENGFCYFAVEIIKSGEFIGFIGITEQIFESDFTPAIDIGWRLKTSAWEKGYATEGAKKCLEFAFNEIKLTSIIATCPKVNSKSENIMKKIGMKFIEEFEHPLLLNDDILKNCLLYKIENESV